VRFVDNGATDYFLVLDSSGGFTTHLDQFVATNSQLVTAQVVSWPATLRQSADGTTFTVTLGTAPSSGLSSTVNTSHGMAWTPKSGPRDRAGNALVVPGSPITETDGDVDF
jgi:hypothetical protein